jgi:hypothetical protein
MNTEKIDVLEDDDEYDEEENVWYCGDKFNPD